jgi:hypothetical protein
MAVAVVGAVAIRRSRMGEIARVSRPFPLLRSSSRGSRFDLADTAREGTLGIRMLAAAELVEGWRLESWLVSTGFFAVSSGFNLHKERSRNEQESHTTSTHDGAAATLVSEAVGALRGISYQETRSGCPERIEVAADGASPCSSRAAAVVGTRASSWQPSACWSSRSADASWSLHVALVPVPSRSRRPALSFSVSKIMDMNSAGCTPRSCC